MPKITIAEDFSLDQSDVNDLSWRWHHTITSIDYLSAKNALVILDSVVYAYMRGRGYKMGNRQGMEKHSNKALKLSSLIIEDASGKFNDIQRFTEAFENMNTKQSKTEGN